MDSFDSRKVEKKKINKNSQNMKNSSTVVIAPLAKTKEVNKKLTNNNNLQLSNVLTRFIRLRLKNFDVRHIYRNGT